MKKALFIKLFAFSLLAVTFVGCNKYEEGSNFSLLSAKARLVNDWKLDKFTATSGGFSVESTPDVTFSIKKDDTFSYKYTSGSSSYTITGTWAFNNDKTTVTTTDSDGETTTYEIKKLKNKELTLVEVDGSTTYTAEYSSQ